MSLQGRVALVTGASSGIGAACAVELAKQGASVLVTYHRGKEGAHDVVARCRALGVEATPVQADVTRAESVAAMMATAAERLGRLDVLVNNAGGSPRKPMLDSTEAEFDQIVALNLKGAFLCIQAGLPLLRKGRNPNVVNISSTAAMVGGSTNETGIYAAAKAGLNSMTRTLARELADEGIRVNAIAAGYVDTPLQDREGHRELFERRARRLPIGRAARPEEIGAVAAFLASDAASYMTGEIVTVAGGL